MKPAVGLADLARLFRAFSVEDHDEAARLLGFRRVADPGAAGVQQRRTRDDRKDDERSATRAAPPPLLHAGDEAAGGSPEPEEGRRGQWWQRWWRSLVSRRPSVHEGPADHARFFRVERAVERETAAMSSPPPPEQGLTHDDLRSDAISVTPVPAPLAPWSTLWSRLRAALQTSRPGRDPDVAALIRTWARGECLRRIPRLKSRSWTASAALWIDRSNRLTPFWDDQEMVYRQLVRICGIAAIQRRVLDADRQASLTAWCGDLIGSREPDPRVPVLVLGDLGFYGTESDRTRWLRTARRLRRNGVQVMALVPCPTDRWDRELARVWNATPWELPSAVGDHGTPEARAEALLRLVAPTALAQPSLLRALRQLLPAATADASTEVDVASARLPSTIAPQELFVRTPQALRRWVARQRGEVLVMVPAQTMPSSRDDELGSPVATIAAATPEVWVRRGNDRGATRTRLTPYVEIPLPPGERITLLTDCSEATLEIWERAPWAIAAGRDRYGLWAAFEVNGVQQRLRWIPPGRFRMGSPPTEAGRYEDEGPEHWVTITNGYWLGETPVTQALWVAVMGKNPSYFRGKWFRDLERPVEQVSWDDCLAFIVQLNIQVAGIAFMLPTEAEWERACRGETHGATWVGDRAGGASELDALAWYQHNSGGTTHPVGRKAPNPYGLHDMLGNVYEWCADAAEDLAKPNPYADVAVTDPVASIPRTHPTLPDAYRIDRGGSWFCSAESVRAARRLTDARGRRLKYVGFRLAGRETSAAR